MFMKLLITAGLIYIVYVAFFKKSLLKPSQHTTPEHDNDADEMLPCAYCHTYTARDEMIISLGKQYCSAECIEEAS